MLYCFGVKRCMCGIPKSFIPNFKPRTSLPNLRDIMDVQATWPLVGCKVGPMKIPPHWFNNAWTFLIRECSLSFHIKLGWQLRCYLEEGLWWMDLCEVEQQCLVRGIGWEEASEHASGPQDYPLDQSCFAVGFHACICSLSWHQQCCLLDSLRKVMLPLRLNQESNLSFLRFPSSSLSENNREHEKVSLEAVQVQHMNRKCC